MDTDIFIIIVEILNIWKEQKSFHLTHHFFSNNMATLYLTLCGCYITIMAMYLFSPSNLPASTLSSVPAQAMYLFPRPTYPPLH